MKTLLRSSCKPAVALFAFGALTLGACSALPGTAAPATPEATFDYSDAAAFTPLPAGGMDAYPAPDLATVPTPGLPKAVTPDPGSLPMYLPIIYNQQRPGFPFMVQGTGALAIQGFSGCAWEGVAGQIFDLSGAPLKNLVLHLEGVWAGQPVSREALSGSTDKYGPAGYEFVLGAQTLDSTESLWIEVRDATAKAISPRVYLDTYNDCARNLILVNFNQVQ